MNIQDILLHLNPFDNNDTVTITSVEEIKEDGCHQDGLRINFEHSRDNKQRSMELYTDLDIDTDNLITSKLNGYIYNKVSSDIEEEQENEHQIEILRTYLQKELIINFENEYKERPFVIVNIDKKFESLYRTYSLEYLSSDNNLSYYGVKITFNSLKLKTVYPGINIIIIGDRNE